MDEAQKYAGQNTQKYILTPFKTFNNRKNKSSDRSQNNCFRKAQKTHTEILGQRHKESF